MLVATKAVLTETEPVMSTHWKVAPTNFHCKTSMVATEPPLLYCAVINRSLGVRPPLAKRGSPATAPAGSVTKCPQGAEEQPTSVILFRVAWFNSKSTLDVPLFDKRSAEAVTQRCPLASTEIWT